MPVSAWRFVASLFGASVWWLISAPGALAQMTITPPVDEEPRPNIIVRPVVADEEGAQAPTVADNDNPETLKLRLKETEDRLHLYEKDYEAIKRQNQQFTRSIGMVSESLAVANAEGEVFRRQYTDQKTLMEALGLAAVGDNKEALQERLLQAVNDLRLAKEERNKLADAMLGLTESVLLYMKTASNSDPQLRLQVETQLRAANDAVDAAAAQEAPQTRLVEGNLNNGKVLSVEDKLSLVVVNFGSLQGIKVGAPVQIVRGDKFVARGRLVDIRQRISGIVVEEYASSTEKVKVGDTVRVDVQS